MTREEAIMVLKNEQPHCGKKALFPEGKKYEAYDVAIKALEQEPILDKIRAEIVSDEEKWWYGVDNDCYMKLSDVLKIINKYKVKSENEK